MNKSVKKVFAVAVALCLAFAMVACSGTSTKSKYVGTWKLTSVDAGGMQIDPASMGQEMTFEFKEDGKLIMSTSGETPAEGSWEEKDDGIELKDESSAGSSAMTGKLEDGKLVLEMQGMKMIFEKQ